MKIATFYLQQTLLLGTAGFFAWLYVGWWRFEWFWADDAHLGWLAALAISGAFIALVCTPIQVALSKLRGDWVAYIGGFAAGPIAVLLYLAFCTRFEISWHNYVVRQAWMHLLFGLMGLGFAIAYRRRFGPRVTLQPVSPSGGVSN